MNKNLTVLWLSAVLLARASAFCGEPAALELPVAARESVMRIGAIPLFVTENGKKAAADFWAALETRDKGALARLAPRYAELLRTENDSGDYGALKWLCETISASDADRRGLISDALSEDFYSYFTEKDCANLKEYLLRKYKVNDFEPEDMKVHLERRSFLEDLMMFNNPRRGDWERSDEILRRIGLKPGDTVVDVGSGLGYYAYRFSKLVGARGKVFAADTNSVYAEHVKKFAEEHGVGNLFPVASAVSDVSVSTPSDVVFMCSVYHIIYGWSREADRVPFMASIKRSLKPGGLLVIADNAYAGGGELNSCYISKELIVAQLHYYGFTLLEHVEITPKRYLLVFRHGQGPPPDLGAGGKAAGAAYLKIASGGSLMHIGSLDSYDITEKGIEAARSVYDALKNKNLDAARRAIRLYDAIVPTENFGGEYTALQWFCEYLAADDGKRRAMLEDPLVKGYYDYLAKNDYKALRKYVDFKYKLSQEKVEEREDLEDQAAAKPTEEDREVGRTQREFLEDFILFNNPRREAWEKTGRILDALGLKPGQKIGDIGSGSGYYTYRFSRLVGDGGLVYAMDVKDGHLDFLKGFVKERKITNVRLIRSKLDDISLDDQVDYLFMCSLYHMIYGVSSEPDRAKLIGSIKKALKQDGRLVIVDNGPVEGELMPYHGPYLARELIAIQLAHYGFALERYEQIIPQRYMLVFRQI